MRLLVPQFDVFLLLIEILHFFDVDLVLLVARHHDALELFFGADVLFSYKLLLGLALIQVTF